MSHSTSKNNALGFMAGLGFGAGMALLFAPRSGVRTRVLLARTTRKGTNYLKQQATTLQDTATDIIEKGHRQAEGIKRAVETGKKAYLQSVG
jgi:gas vesicle protein